MSSLKTKYLISILMGLLLAVGTGSMPLTMAHGNLSGKLVYTAEVPRLSSTDLMFTVTLGSNSEAGRSLIAGDKNNSVAYPKSNSSGQAILCHAFPDTDQNGTIDQSTTTPLVGVLKPDGTDLTVLTSTKQGAAYDATFSLDERHIAFPFANVDTDGDGKLTIQDKAQLAIKELGQIDPLNPTPRQLASNKPIKILTKNANFSVKKPVYLTNDLIVFTGENLDSGSTIVYMYDLINENLTPIAPANAQTRNPAVSKDGTQIAVEVTTLTESYDAIYDIASKAWFRLPTSGLTYNTIAWSVNRTLAIAMSDGSNWQIMIFDGTTLSKLIDIPYKVSLLDFSPDGKAIAYLWDRDGSNHNVLAVATLDGGYSADVSALDSNVKDFDWISES